MVSDSELPILLLGETGVGKELFAHRVHRLSRRRAKPLVHVNCAALPESLAESELFGHAKGAFSARWPTGPAANGGTLFLDEVGELPLLVQAKLLRALQNGEIQRLGDDRPRRVDVRIVAATNRSLKDLVRDGDFRADLYHRLSVYPIAIPPLRARQRRAAAGRPLPGTEPRPAGPAQPGLALDAEEALRRYRWPGNVRELEHVISRAAIKAVSRGANRNHIVTLEASLLDLSGADLRPLAPAPDAPPATTPDGVLPAARRRGRLPAPARPAGAASARRQLGRGRPRVGGGPQQPAQAGAPAGLEGLRAARYHPCPMKER